LENAKVNETVRAGETLVNSIRIHNRSDESMDIKIYWQDFEYVAPYKRQKKFYPMGTSKYTMGEWTAFSPQHMILPAHSAKEVTYTIQVPETASGGYYGALFFERGGPRGADSTGVNIVVRLGASFFIETVDKDKTATLADFNVVDNHLEASFSNSGNVFMIPRGIYYYINAEGLVVERGEMDKVYLPPEASVNVEAPVPSSLGDGQFLGVITLDLGDGYSLVKEIDFTLINGQITIDEQRD